MQISLSAVQPVHFWPMAQELFRKQSLGCLYSGQPRWVLGDNPAVSLKCRSNESYAAYFLNRLPLKVRPDSDRIKRWQNERFDLWVSQDLLPADFLHGVPGQSLHSFRRAKQMGIRTVLNHTQPPLWQRNAWMTEEWSRVGLAKPVFSEADKAEEDRQREEFALADIHWAASSLIKEKLIASGITDRRIWVIPYGADQEIFFPPKIVAPTSNGFRIVFAGNLELRNGVRTLLEALCYLNRPDWSLDCYGPISEETRKDSKKYKGETEVVFFGPSSAQKLARAFRYASLLVLPSLEEGFGDVIPQALSCGLPCLVSDAVGAKDLIRHRDNGSIFPVKNYEALADEISWWHQNQSRPLSPQPWSGPAERLMALSLEEWGQRESVD